MQLKKKYLFVAITCISVSVVVICGIQFNYFSSYAYKRGYMSEHGVENDYDMKSAIFWYEVSSKIGNIDAMRKLGAIYENPGILFDINKSIEWYTKAAGKGDAYSQLHLGFLYSDNAAVSGDYIESYKWFTIAIKGNSSGDNAKEMRSYIEYKMAPAEVMRANNLAKEWLKHKQ